MPRAWKRHTDYSRSSLLRFKRQRQDDFIDDLPSEHNEDFYHNLGHASDQDNNSDEQCDQTPQSDELSFAHSELEFDNSELESVQSDLIGERGSIAEQRELIHEVVQNQSDSDRSESDSDSNIESIVGFQLLPPDDHSMNRTDSEGDEQDARSIDNGRSECSELESQHSDYASDLESLMNEEPYPARRNDNEPLYDGAPLTTSESVISIMSLSLRHNVSDALLTDILKCVALHCPPDNSCKTTLYTFNKCFSEEQTPLIRHFFCTTCFRSIETQNSVCPTCEDQSKISYFIEGVIVSQIRNLFKRPGFQESIQHRHTRVRTNPNNYEDIYDGLVYKDLSRNGGFLESAANLSLTWYTDGVRIFKSSKFNIWPFYLIINELPLSLRTKKENIIFAGLWFGDEKPVPNLFLRPLEQSIRELYHGVDVDIPNVEAPLVVRAIIICGTCDLPAKALFLNMNQYNGRFGCQKCKNEGQYLPADKVRVYPYRPLNLRTDEETCLHAQQASDAGFAVCGVKGPTILRLMVHEFMRATAVDAMHCVFEGVVKNLLGFWFSPQFSEHTSSLVQHNDLVDQRLKSLTPPSFVQRRPRSIKEHLSYWKAYELKAWFFYYSIPCIHDIMDQRYFEHYLLLVLGVSILFHASISPEDVIVASRALNEFVSRYEHLYGLRYMTNNVHQLLHLAENTIQFGPLWVTSCFPYEDLNGRLKMMVHGSNAAQLQIYSTVSKFLHLTSLKAESLIEGRPAHEFCENLNSRIGRMKRHCIADSVYIVGKCTELRQLPRELDELFTDANIGESKYFYYTRLLQQNVMYSSSEYRLSRHTNSSFAVYISQDGEELIGRIRCFVRITDCRCPGLCHCLSRNYAILTRCHLENQFSICIDRTVLNSMHTVLDFENHERAVDIINLRTVCFYCHIEDSSCSYIVEPVNRIEWE